MLLIGQTFFKVDTIMEMNVGLECSETIDWVD